uniref:Longin domain-containing protein n=1 Tax=Kalanchoe fedtschenkoi TaxID=63787 RepID=A0A7N1A1Z5_KALFE
MKQESFMYSFVARGTMVLAEYTEYTGNFPSIAAQCLQKLPSTNNKFTYSCDHHTFNFLLEEGYAYCVVAKETVGKQISIAEINRHQLSRINQSIQKESLISWP